MSYFYLATPYTKYPFGVDAAWKLACLENARLLKAGIPVYSPIAHSVAVSNHSDGMIAADDWELWMQFDHCMMKPAIGIIILEAASWERSTGMAEELHTFELAGKPVIRMIPGVVPSELLHLRMDHVDRS